MRYKFIILFLFISFVSKAQVYQLMPQYGYSTYRMNFDSTIQIPTFCGVPKLGSNKINKGALAFDSCNNRFYFFNPKLQVWDTIKSADASLFVKYTDTAQMLSPYLKKQDTLSLSNRIEGRIDSLKLSNDSIYARKNNQFVFQYMNDTATVVKASVRNSESFTINRGQVVYIFGASGDKASVKLADNSGDITSARTLGIVRESIAAGQIGWVTTQGQVGKLQLGAYNEGDILWLDSIPGGFTKTKPVAPRHSVFLGVVERANNGNGIAYVKPQNGYELGELHDVKITSPQTNEVLAYTTNIWENKNIYSIVDTTSLSNRINTKLNISDTSSMLNPYLRNSDTISLSNRINTKLNISDTSAMLSPYLRSIDTTNKYVTSVFRKTASDSVFFVRGGSNNFAFRDSTGGANIYNTDGTLTGNRTVTMGSNTLSFSGDVFVNSVRVGRGKGTTTSNTILGDGIQANQSNPTGTANTFIGQGVAINVTTASGNTAIGQGAFLVNSTGIRNVAVGQSALNGASGSSNVGIGYFAANSASDNAVGVGSNALQNSTGANNVGIGYFAGRYNTSTTNQIFLNSLDRTNYSGDQTGSPFYAQQNTTVTSQIVTLNGRVGINTISPSASAGLQVESTTQGFLQPRLTTTQMNAISTPATGLSVFNTTDSSNYIYRGTSGWRRIASGSPSYGIDVPSGGFRFNASGEVSVMQAYGSDMFRATSNNNGQFQFGVFTSPPSVNAKIQIQNSSNTFHAMSIITPTNQLGNGSRIAWYNGGLSGGIFYHSDTTLWDMGFFNKHGNNSGGGIIHMFPNGNVLLTNGARTDAGYKLDVSGTARIQNKLSVGTPTAASAIMEVTSTTQGFMPPRMTTSERDLIASPAAGLIIYNSTINKHQGYNGTTWNDFY